MNATVTTNVNGIEVHHGRWGFYPCDHQTYLELKEYHRYALRDLKGSKRHRRWSAKLTHNRVNKAGEPVAEPAAQGTSLDQYLWVLEEYRNARHPKANPDDVMRLELPRGWLESLAAYRAFYTQA